MGFNFPNAPTIGQLHPTPAVVGLPQYQWNGSEWVTPTYNPLNYVLKSGDTMLGALNVVTPPTAPTHAASKSYVDTYAAPLDALSYSGMQVNGGMEVSQENGAGAVTGIINTGKYVVDGWFVSSFGPQNMSASIANAFPSGFISSLQVWASVNNVAPAANDVCTIRQNIEGYRVARLAWGTAAASPITIGFWVYSTRTGNYSGSVGNQASNRSYVFSFNVSAAGVFEYKTITIPGDITGTWNKTNDVGMTLAFAMMAGSANQTAPGIWVSGNFSGATGTINGIAAVNDSMLITGVVVLPGIYAPTAAQSPLIMRSYDQELVTCQRYYEPLRMNDNGYGPIVIAYARFQPFSVSKRAVPTLTTGADGTSSNLATAVFDTPAELGCRALLIPAAVGPFHMAGRTGKADARL